jgi:hypothetical protein
MIALLAHRNRELDAPAARGYTLGFWAGLVIGGAYVLLWMFDVLLVMQTRHRRELDQLHDLHNDLLLEILCDPRLRFQEVG